MYICLIMLFLKQICSYIRKNIKQFDRQASNDIEYLTCRLVLVAKETTIGRNH